MRILLKILNALLYFNFATPVLMHYIYDDNPSAGYEAGTSGYRLSNVKDKYVDSHLKVMKTVSRYNKPTLNEDMKNFPQDSRKINDQEIQWERRSIQEENTGGYHDNTRRSAKDMKNHQAFNSPPLNLKDTSNSLSLQHQLQPRTGGPVRKSGLQETKEVNMRKTQMATDKQRFVKMNNNRQPAALSIHRAKENPIVALDNRQHSSDKYNIRDSLFKSRILDDPSKLSDKSYDKFDYRKREITNIQGDLFTHNSIYSNMKKFIGKEKSMKKDYRRNFKMGQARSGSMDPRDRTYSLFYRIIPDSLTHQDRFHLEKSMEEARYV